MIFILPSTIRQSELWIETNDALTNLSEIQITSDHCIVPYHIYEDSLCDDDDINRDMIQCKYHFKYPRSCFSAIQKLREESYHACIWYPDNTIPTADSILIKIKSNKDLKNTLKKYPDYPFVRLCSMSPKDVSPIPLYDRWEDAYHDLTISVRTKDFIGKHLFMRKKKIYEWEVRCFWSHGQLRAVSLPDMLFTEQEDILDFFKQYGKSIPYHSATVDIGKTDRIELIEYNSFGPDMKATAGYFSWVEDVMILLFSPTPIFR